MRSPITGATSGTCAASAALDARLSRLCAWVLAAQARQQPYGLRLPGREWAWSEAPTHRDSVLQALARSLASLDALAALAERSATLGWCRPEFVPYPCIEIEAGRHPVVQARLAETGAGDFIANDCRFVDERRLLLITGPNMGGKSTFMRQVALIVLLAAMGSFVPAASCRLGPIDAIHTRIGAADDLANAQSTFMMEMTEAASIVHGATEHSLVLKIGRAHV